MDVTQLALTWVGCQTVKNLRRLACKFDLDQSERKSSQVNGVASRRKLRTCVYLRLRLARALVSMFAHLQLRWTWHTPDKTIFSHYKQSKLSWLEPQSNSFYLFFQLVFSSVSIFSRQSSVLEDKWPFSIFQLSIMHSVYPLNFV